MKILFSHSYFLQFDLKQVAHARPYPPLGTIWAAALLRENGHEVFLFDSMFAHSPEALIASLKKYKPDVFVIYDDGFNYLTKMCLSNMREAAFLMQQYAKAYGCAVITTSSDAADHYEAYLQNGADYVMYGEAEYILLETIRHIEEGTGVKDSIKGLIYLQNGSAHKNGARPLSKHLDELPLPAWDLVDIEPYKKVWMKHHGYFSINMATTRGCPYKCNWCAKPIYGNNYNMRSPENVVREMIFLKKIFDMDHIWFCDDIFGLKRSWVKEFAELVMKVDIKTDFKIQSRADLLIQEKYVSDLAAAGCTEVWLGAESGSQRILDAMDKGTTINEIKQARNSLQQHDIRAAFFIQFGYLGETMEDINKTIDLITETMPDDIGISVSYPLPGTKFYEKVKQDMIAKKNWTDSDDLDMMYAGTYESPFYKKLHKYTHYAYRLQKLKKESPRSPVAIFKIVKYTVLKSRLRKELNKHTRSVAHANIQQHFNPIMELN